MFLNFSQSSFWKLKLIRKGSQVNGFIGVHNIDMKIELPNRISINNLVDNVFIYPNWNRITRNADQAIINLKTKILYNGELFYIFYNLVFVKSSSFSLLWTIDYISPICKPKYSYTNQAINEAITLAGWGTAYDGFLKNLFHV